MARQIAIELNDSGIIVRDESRLLLESPGYIIDLAGKEWIGKDARSRAQLHPNECNHHFWSELARMQTNAADKSNVKLALRHLNSIWTQVSSNVETVILTVPAMFSKTGLGLLLGICKELAIPVHAMIHHAALTPKQTNHTGDTIHVDMLLHHTAITPLQEQQGEFRAGQTQLLNNIGWMSIYTAAAEFIAQNFIRTTRLDPMHSAEMEQQLFNNLPGWLEAAQKSELVRCQLQHQSSLFEVTINAEDLNKTLNSKLSKIINALSSLDPIQPVIACVPDAINMQLGFNKFANDHGIMIRPLQAGYHAQQGLLHADQLVDNDLQIYLNKQLPYTTLSDPLPTSSNIRTKKFEAPTHILYRHRAFPLKDVLYLTGSTDTGFQLQNTPGQQQEILSIHCNASTLEIEIANGQEVTVNDQVVQAYTKPSVGDCIRIASNADELVFIKAEN